MGESTPRKVNFRLIAATHRDLRQDVADGRFRMDFYYRVAVTSIRIPPLRDRKTDIRLLVQHFVKRFCDLHGLELRRLEEALLIRLESYSWPGNIRELRNVIESMLLMSDQRVLGVDALPPEFNDEGLNEHHQLPEDRITKFSLYESEADLIRQVIMSTKGNLTQAAWKLAIAKSTLYQKIKRYGLEQAIGQARRIDF